LKSPWDKIGREWVAEKSALRHWDKLPDGKPVDSIQLTAQFAEKVGREDREVTSWTGFMANGKKVTIFND
jgi:hypothetical protein